MLKKLANTEIGVRNWKEIVDWYVNILGLEIAYSEERNNWCVLTFPGGRSGLIIRGLGKLDTSVDNRVVPQIQTDSLEQTIAGLEKKGVQPLPSISEATRDDGRSYRWIKLTDPEGNLMRIYEGQL